MEIGYKENLYIDIPTPFALEGEILINPFVYLVIRPNGNPSVTYEKGKSGVKKILNYLKVYRPQDVWIKVLSRSKAEAIKNDKWLVCGLAKDQQGQDLVFYHPSAQYFQSCLAVANAWTYYPDKLHVDINGWAKAENIGSVQQLFETFANEISLVSGKIPQTSTGHLQALLTFIQSQAKHVKPIPEVFSNRKAPSKTHKISAPGKAAVLFGYGNYARTITLPYLKPYIHLARVHEIDPALQIGSGVEDFSTKPHPEEGDYQYPVWLIAGYHHTHAAQAIDAIVHGNIAVIEKPIATTFSELEAFQTAIEEHKTPFYQCFQKRYQVYNDFIKKDLKLENGQPVNIKATVFEIPLTKSHWYNWPASGSRIISNGCHWIDHFLFINGYCDWNDFEVEILSPEELLIYIKLVNGAVSVLTLSDVGSNRIGMREYTEFSVPGYRATLIDSMHYRSENNSGLIREYKSDKLAYLRKMYKEIGRNIANNFGGDDPKTLKSTRLSLLLEERYQKKNSRIPSLINQNFK